jgi:hypothetical protein
VSNIGMAVYYILLALPAYLSPLRNARELPTQTDPAGT